MGLILGADNHHPFLSEKEFKFVKNRAYDYVEKENDVRGYIAGKGWAHSLAHAADTLDEIAKHAYATEEV